MSSSTTLHPPMPGGPESMPPAPSSAEQRPSLTEVAHQIERQLGSILMGKPRQVRVMTAAILTGSHVLLHDVPGVGKTTLASAAARVVGGEFRRIQGSPDLLPTDLTGSVVLDQKTGDWRYRPGPLLGNVILVDEINRISPRSQSALLQVMAERQISIEGMVRPLPDPYLVIATMNPTGSSGTFELASGQLDRFEVALSLGTVDRATERQLLRQESGPEMASHLTAALPAAAWAQVRKAVAAVHVADAITEYLLDICDDVRQAGYVSVRASRALIRMAQGIAVLEGRNFVVPDDIKTLAPACLAHRLIEPGVTLESLTNRVIAATERANAPIVNR
ncbi:MAG: AAA family ATPase [Acidimicrobiales bacterium]